MLRWVHVGSQHVVMHNRRVATNSHIVATLVHLTYKEETFPIRMPVVCRLAWTRLCNGRLLVISVASCS